MAAALRSASARGELPDLGFGRYFLLADAITDAGVAASDAELDLFIADCCGDGNGVGFSLFEEKLTASAGSFIDIIMQLLPVLLPLLIGCL